MSMKNYYHLLGVERDASKGEINLAYLQLARAMYRSIQKGRESLEPHFEKLKEAFEILSDNKKRAEYDILLQQSILKESTEEVSKKKEGRVNVPVDLFSGGMHKNRDLQKKIESIEQRKEKFIPEAGNRLKKYFKIAAVVIGAVVVIKVLTVYEWESDDSLQADHQTESRIEQLQKSRTEVALLKEDKVTYPTAAKKASKDKSKPQARETHAPSQPSFAKRILNRKTASPKIETSDLVTHSKDKEEAGKGLVTKSIKKDVKDIRRTGNERILSQAELEAIAYSISLTNPTSKGIRIVKAAGSNISNAYAIAPLLQSKGYVIAGRDISYRSAEGVTVEESKDCISLVMGKFAGNTEIPGLAEVSKKAPISGPKLIPAVTVVNSSANAKTAQKALSRAEMLNIVESIFSDKAFNSDFNTCISIKQTTESNVSNVSELIPLLQEKGIVIAGRGFTRYSANGVEVNFGSSCITLTVGFINRKNEAVATVIH